MADLFRRCGRYYCECSEDGVQGQNKSSGIDKCPCTTVDVYSYCLYRETKYPEEPARK